MTHTLEELIPDYIQGLAAYVPGKPIEEVEQDLKIHAVKLASNENPLGPSPKAMAAARQALGEANWYPDGGSKRLREVLAGRYGVRQEEVFVGLGSSEIIDLASRVLLRPGLTGITSEGSFALFAIAIRASGGNLVQTPMRNYTFDLDAIAAAVTPETRVIYIANPNNPTGTAFGAAEFDIFLKKVPGDVLVVLDEAYTEYAERRDLPKAMEIFKEYNNLLTLKTLSKVYGLAGLRIGYGIGHPTLVAEMNKLRTPFNVTSVGQAAAWRSSPVDGGDDLLRALRRSSKNIGQRLVIRIEVVARCLHSAIFCEIDSGLFPCTAAASAWSVMASVWRADCSLPSKSSLAFCSSASSMRVRISRRCS